MIRFFDNKICSNPGDPIRIIYSPIVNDDGSISLVESGKENTDDYIQSFAEECDLHNIINRYLNGDIEVLNKRQGSYGDFTEFPKTYAEALQLQIDATNMFNSLPTDIKEKFDNDVNKFFVSSGSDEWFEKLKPVMEMKKQVEEVKEESEVI